MDGLGGGGSLVIAKACTAWSRVTAGIAPRRRARQVRGGRTARSCAPQAMVDAQSVEIWGASPQSPIGHGAATPCASVGRSSAISTGGAATATVVAAIGGAMIVATVGVGAVVVVASVVAAVPCAPFVAAAAKPDTGVARARHKARIKRRIGPVQLMDPTMKPPGPAVNRRACRRGPVPPALHPRASVAETHAAAEASDRHGKASAGVVSGLSPTMWRVSQDAHPVGGKVGPGAFRRRDAGGARFVLRDHQSVMRCAYRTVAGRLSGGFDAPKRRENRSGRRSTGA